MRRRQFIQDSGKTALAAGATWILPSTNSGKSVPKFPKTNKSPEDLVQDESYWNSIRKFFSVPTDFINLENGYFSPQPISTLYFHQQRENYINSRTSHYMRVELAEILEEVRNNLAGFLQVKTEELAITRNTTESLNTVISGYPWKSGDEVIIGNQDYGSMVAAFTQAAFRHKIKIKVAEVPLQPAGDDDIVNAYMKLVTKKTRLIHLTHLINISGQVIPVKRIVKEAKMRKIEVAVDCAHSIAHIPFSIEDFGADYVAGSLHKWLCCPLGTGFLWMKGNKIPLIWPLMGDSDYPITKIQKFEHQGTRAIQSLESIKPAIEFHNEIGGELKVKRLKYLMQLWCEELSKIPGISILTPWEDDKRNSAIATFAVRGHSPEHVSKILMEKHQIFTVAISTKAVNGVRVTPHIYTLKKDVEAFVEAVKTEFGK
ncbi:MAG: aminotransferase class V-fold PLP-dependent enzyme [Bacteroidetes bacterium]|nr:aminotransferase class V-fold PLP-dependent enzyme [Bacteroidota bacterium]